MQVVKGEEAKESWLKCMHVKKMNEHRDPAAPTVSDPDKLGKLLSNVIGGCEKKERCTLAHTFPQTQTTDYRQNGV